LIKEYKNLRMKNFLGIFLLHIICGAASAQVSYVLQPTASTIIESKFSNSVTMDMMGKSLSTNSNQYFKIQYVKTDAQGNVYFIAAIDSFNMKMEEGDKVKIINSNSKESLEKRNALMKNLGKVDEAIPFKVSKQGQITFLDAANTNTDFLKDLFIVFPEKPLQPKVTWTIVDSISMSTENPPLSELQDASNTLQQISTYTVGKITEQEIEIFCEQKVDMYGELTTSPINYIIDRKTGLVKSYTSAFTSKSIMEMKVNANYTAKW
jgi:hypothetical protein